MTIIKSTKDLKVFCKKLESAPFITVDTEFLRDKTYYSKLCLIQVSGPDKKAVAIDVIEAPDIDLSPLLELFRNKKILKVFHAGRQDLEIFWQQFQTLPDPIFDTQIAAMVCGYGDQIGFDNLMRKITGKTIDKSQQFTDWSRRPLSKKQLSYALDDVILLVDIFEALDKQLISRDREDWVLEETSALLDKNLYENKPEEAWERIKVKSPRPKQLAILRELAAWREAKAQEQDIPRTRIIRDETLVDISFHPPSKPEDLGRIRGFPKGCEDKPLGAALMNAANKGLESDKSTYPKVVKKAPLQAQYQAAFQMLKMLLKIKAAENDVAARLIASKEDLEIIAEYGAKGRTPALKGWRNRIFGEDAIKMLSGNICLRLDNNEVCLTKID
ncbi:MAG: ribonuclease D [Micavibrio sp.]|nr:ribonuclease D [Micavibrio sp.]